MNNQPHWNESFEGLPSNQADPQYQLEIPHSVSLHQQVEEDIQRGHNGLAHLEALQQISHPILESSRQGGNGSWQQGESSRQQQQQPFSQQQQEVHGQQTYFRIGPNGEREMIRVTAIGPPPTNHVNLPFPPQQIILGPKSQQLPPHYPPSPRISHGPPQKSTQFKSLDNLRNVTQQSFAPSQKTIVLNHINSQMGGVYHSHVSTERMPIQPQREGNTRHSHVHDTRVGSPSRISFDYGQIKPEVGRNLFSSYIPTSGPPAIPQHGVATTTSNAPQASERHDHPDQVNFWREKYEQLGRRCQATRIKEGKEQEVALNKFTALQKNYQILQASYDQIVQDYHAKLDQNQQYFEQIQQLQATINQLQLAPKREQNTQGLQKALQQKSMLVGLLRKENQQFQAHLQQIEQRHEQEMREMQEHATMLQMEIQQREAQLRQKSQLKTSNIRKSQNSQLDRSRMESFQNTRVMELEMHVGKLNAELNMREDSFERQLKMANLNVAELVEKLKSQAKQKDQTISNLQEKVGLLESDLNKKESIIRNLRDQVSKTSTSAQPAASLYSSAVNPVDNRVGDRQQVFKKQLQNIRRNLFQRQREKLILKQKYEQLQQRLIQTEEALGRRKVQNQEMRRQLNELDNLQHQNQKLMEVLNKKNAQLLELKEMLMEKEQHAGDFENLSKQNDRLRAFMLKKNEQLSDLAEKLYNQQKKTRELQLAHTPQIHELEEELQRLYDMLERKDIEISKLNQSLELIQGNFSEIQFELQRHKNINHQFEAQIKDDMMKLQAYQEDLAAMQGEKHLMQSELQALRDKIRQYQQELAHRQKAEAALLSKLRQIEVELKLKQFQLENIATQQIQLRQFKQKSTKEIQQFQSKQGDLQSRCRDLQSMLRNREQRLARAQKQLEEGRQQIKKHQSCARQIQQMTQKISHYQMRIISLTLKRSRSGLTDYPPPSEIFQNKLIYNLKRENQALRQQLGQLGNGDSSKTNEVISQQRYRKGSQIKMRLDQFNQNLQNAIGGTMKRVRSLDVLQPIVVEDQTKQIERLKKLAQQMQKQQLQQQQSFSHKKNISSNQLQQLYQEQLNFYRNTNSELQKRVCDLLRLNKQLKQQIEEAALNRGGSSLKEFYEEEIRRLERQVGQLQADKGRSGQASKKLQKRVRQLEEQLFRVRRRGESPELSYNFQVMRPNNKTFD